MSSIHPKFISGFDDKVAELLVPAISEGQVITAYIDEPISPYSILGENFFVPSTVGLPLHEVHSISNAEISAMSFSLSHQILFDRQDSITVSLNGCPLIIGIDFIITGHSIAWNGLALQFFGLIEGDVFSVSYPTLEV